MQSSVAETVSKPAMRNRKQMSRMSSRSQLLSVDLGVEEPAQQIVPPFGLTLVQQLVEVLVDGVGRPLLEIMHLRTPIRDTQHHVGPDDAVLHGQEPGELLDGEAEQTEEHLRRERHGELLGEVHSAVSDEAVDQEVDGLFDRRFEEGRLSRGEDGIEQLSKLLVVGRVDLQRNEGTGILQVHGVRIRGEDLWMPKHLIGLRLPGHHDHAVEGKYRRAVTKGLEQGLRIRRRLGVHQVHRRIGGHGRLGHHPLLPPQGLPPETDVFILAQADRRRRPRVGPPPRKISYADRLSRTLGRGLGTRPFCPDEDPSPVTPATMKSRRTSMLIVRERIDQIEVLTLNRPEAANSLNPGLLDELGRALAEILDDDSARAVVVTGAGERIFCGGMDLSALGEFNEQSGGAGPRLGSEALAQFMGGTYPKPLVAAVNGAAVGGGLELVLACDLVVAAEHARFGLPEVKRGLYAAEGAPCSPYGYLRRSPWRWASPAG